MRETGWGQIVHTVTRISQGEGQPGNRLNGIPVVRVLESYFVFQQVEQLVEDRHLHAYGVTELVELPRLRKYNIAK